MHSTLPSTVPTVVEGRPAAPGVFVSPDSSTDGPVKGPANQTSTLQAATSSTVVAWPHHRKIPPGARSAPTLACKSACASFPPSLAFSRKQQADLLRSERHLRSTHGLGSGSSRSRRGASLRGAVLGTVTRRSSWSGGSGGGGCSR
jgi:hypothetical protein